MVDFTSAERPAGWTAAWRASRRRRQDGAHHSPQGPVARRTQSPSHARARAWRGAPPMAPPWGPSRAAGRGAGGWAWARDGRKVDFRSGQRLAGRGTSSWTATRVRGERDWRRPRVRRTSKCRSAAGWRLRSPRRPIPIIGGRPRPPVGKGFGWTVTVLFGSPVCQQDTKFNQ